MYLIRPDINPFTNKPVKQDGRVIFLAGATGTRKTTWIREQVLLRVNLPRYINDIDREFMPEFHNVPYINPSEFKKKVQDKWESIFVFSEAGIYFSHKEGVDMVMREILKSARKRGNWVVFDFHAISELPVEMLRFCNYLVIKKTVMETSQQINKFKQYPEILEAYTKVMNSANEFETVILNPRNLRVEF